MKMNDILLEKDIISFMKSKIKYVKCIDEILESNFIADENLYEKNEQLYIKLGNCRRELQLILNIYNSYDIYNSFSIKLMPTFDNLFVHDEDKDLWICKRRPKDEEVKKALYNYVQCLKSLQIESSTVEVKDEDVHFNECPFCNGFISDINIDCTGCGSHYEEMRDYIKKHYIKQVKKDIFTEIKVQEINDNNEEKWKCGGCGSYNDYVFGNCKICTEKYMNGKWICRGCKKENNCAENHCNNCGKSNVMNENVEKDDVKIKNVLKYTCETCGSETGGSDRGCGICMKKNDLKEENIKYDKWKCDKCGLLQSFSFIICDACGVSRRECGSWTCPQCTLVNKCRNTNCEICGYENNLLDILSSYRNDNINKVTMNNEEKKGASINIIKKPTINSWTCTSTKCGEKNNDEDKFCYKCRLSRFHSRVRGDPVQILEYGDEVGVWICNKCFDYNQLTLGRCKCGETRYKKRFCQHCQIYNDGTTISCEKCNKRS